MQVNNIDRANFGHILVIDPKITKRANKVQKEELKLLKRKFSENGYSGKIKVGLQKAYSVELTETRSRSRFKKTDNIKKVDSTRITVKDIISIVRSKYNEIKSEGIKNAVIYEVFGDGYIL